MLPALKHKILNLIFPPVCVVCECEMESSSPSQPIATLICRQCQLKICDTSHSRCQKCSARIVLNEFGVDGLAGDGSAQGCRICRNEKWKFENVFSLGNYDGELRKLVIQLKKSGSDAISFHAGRLLGQQFGEHAPWFADLDSIVYIPSQWRRSFVRPFNPAELIAEGFGEYTLLPIIDNALDYNRETDKQGRLTRRQRFSNLKNAISLTTRVNLRDRNILLVDDVLTSGATTNESAKVLLSAGAAQVFVATIARGVGYS